MRHPKRPAPPTDKNYVLHDNIEITGTINYTARYRFYNAIEEMLDIKIAQAKSMRAMGLQQMPIVHVNLACPDEKEYKKQSKRFFALMNNAKANGVIIATNIIGPICMNSWAGQFLMNSSTPGFRAIYEEAYHYYYPETYDKSRRKMVRSPEKKIVPHEEMLQTGLCNTIYLNNGLIKTR